MPSSTSRAAVRGKAAPKAKVPPARAEEPVSVSAVVARPTPNSSRPPDRTSAVAACSAHASGWWSGSRVTAVPIRMRGARWAITGTAMRGFDRSEKAPPKCSSASHATSKPRVSARPIRSIISP